MIYVFLSAVIAAIFVGYRVLSARQLRRALLQSELSDDQRRMIAQEVPLVNRLPAELRGKLEGKVNLFLEQVDFHGCDGLDVTEEMELAIAAQACLLVVNSDRWYDNLTTILVYPGAFKSRQQRYDGYVVTEEETVRLGESWTRGPVVLSWQHSKLGALDDGDGHNVVLHEFAHQIDDLSGHTNGVPILSDGQTFAEWETAFLSAFGAHVEDVARGRRTVIDPYGAQGHEEFFAVCVEVFFERPAALLADAPEIYAQLSKLFVLDPASWN